MATQSRVAGEPQDQEDAMSHQILLGAILRLGVKVTTDSGSSFSFSSSPRSWSPSSSCGSVGHPALRERLGAAWL